MWLALRGEGIEVARCAIEPLMTDLGLSGAVRGTVTSRWRLPTTLTIRDQPPAEFSHREVSGHAGVIAIEDTVLRVLLNDVELTTHARKPDLQITVLKAYHAAKTPDPQPLTHVRTVMRPSRMS